MDSSFVDLPLDVFLEEIFLDLDSPTIAQLCRTNSQIRSLCLNEPYWKHKFEQVSLTGDFIPNELALTWFQKTRLLTQISEPKSIVTMFIRYRKGRQKYYYPQSFVLKIHELTSRQHLIDCTLSMYNKRIEPFYSYLKAYLERNPKWAGNKLNLFIQNYIGARNIPYETNSLIDLNDNLSNVWTLTRYDQYGHPNPLFTVRSDNKEKIYSLIAMLLNYNMGKYVGILSYDIDRLGKAKSYFTGNDVKEILNQVDFGERRYIIEQGSLYKCS